MHYLVLGLEGLGILAAIVLVVIVIAVAGLMSDYDNGGNPFQ